MTKLVEITMDQDFLLKNFDLVGNFVKQEINRKLHEMGKPPLPEENDSKDSAIDKGLQDPIKSIKK